MLGRSKKQKLRVLYLGGQADWTHGEMGSNDHFKSEAEFQAEVAKREASFGDLLRTYFTTVKTMQAKDWKPEMSNGYDVTIFDGCPPVLKETEKEYIFKGVSRTMKEKSIFHKIILALLSLLLVWEKELGKIWNQERLALSLSGCRCPQHEFAASYFQGTFQD